MHRMIFKYEEMLRLRLAIGTESPIEDLRRLSAEFPGALRELDRLPVLEIERRLSELRSGKHVPLLEAIELYHRQMREALTRKNANERGRRLSDETLLVVADALRIPANDLREGLGLRRRASTG